MRTPEETLGQLDEIEARAKHITPGDWVLWVGTRDRSGAWELCRKDGVVIAARNSCPSRRVESEATALLFLYAREDVSDLVELVRHLVAERDEARRERDAFVNLLDPAHHNIVNAMVEAQRFVAERDHAQDDGMFYILDATMTVGNCAVWWAPQAYGYTCNLHAAGKFTESRVRQLVRASDIGIPCDVAERLASSHVDARDLEWRTARRGHTDALELHMDHVQQMAAHERPLPNTNEPEDQHVPHIQTEDEP